MSVAFIILCCAVIVTAAMVGKPVGYIGAGLAVISLLVNLLVR
jgi:hypothetical protein